MTTINKLSAVVAVALCCYGPQAFAQFHDPRAPDPDPLTATEQIAPVLDGLGEHGFEVTTDSAESQYFFNQGLRLTYGFNHSEALRAFKEAIRLDPNNAMAYWGWALVLGPNINLPMQPEVAEQAFEAIQAAVLLKGNATEIERGYIDLELICRDDQHVTQYMQWARTDSASQRSEYPSLREQT